MDRIVLIVEDNEDNLELGLKILNRAGYTAISAANGEEGVRLAEEVKPGLVLMDMSLPVMDGWEATRQIKQRLTGVPVVALTAHAMRSDELKARAAGCDDYLVKPYTPTELLAKVRRFLP